MKTSHLAVRVSSVHEVNSPYTASGLGDRIHLMTIAWAYSNANNAHVTMHISSNGMTPKKRTSFDEIVSLFPKGKIGLVIHQFEGTCESEWLQYLSNQGVDAQAFYYGDHLGRYERKVGIDISTYLRNFPKLSVTPESPSNFKLAERYVTTQWDSTARSRTLTEATRVDILNKYLASGYEVVVLGGESLQEPLRNSLSAASAALSRAEKHVGVDSGFMHLAFLFLDFSNIHLYADPKGYWAHHLFRAFENGCILNYHYSRPSNLQKLRIKLLYDSRVMNRILFSNPNILRILRRIGDSLKFLRARA